MYYDRHFGCYMSAPGECEWEPPSKAQKLLEKYEDTFLQLYWKAEELSTECAAAFKEAYDVFDGLDLSDALRDFIPGLTPTPYFEVYDAIVDLVKVSRPLTKELGLASIRLPRRS